MEMALNCYYHAILFVQNLVDRLTIVTLPLEEYLPTVKEQFDKVRMWCMPMAVKDKHSQGLILD